MAAKKAHPGFKAVQAKIAKKEGVSSTNASYQQSNFHASNPIL